MTKISIIGIEPTKEKELKSIELLKALTSGFKINDSVTEDAAEFEFLELICKDYANGYDLIFCYNDPEHRGKGTLFLGHFNDGIV